MTVPWSLGYFKETGERIIVYCPNGHGAPVDLDVVIEHFGADFRIVPNRPQFLASFKCKTCGQRGYTLSLLPGNPGPAV